MIGFELEAAIPVSRHVAGEENIGVMSPDDQRLLRGQLVADAKGAPDEMKEDLTPAPLGRVISHEIVDPAAAADIHLTADNGANRLRIALANLELVTKATPMDADEPTALAAEAHKLADAQGLIAGLRHSAEAGRTRRGDYVVGYPTDEQVDALYGDAERPDKATPIKAHFAKGRERLSGDVYVQANIDVTLRNLADLIPGAKAAFPDRLVEDRLPSKKNRKQIGKFVDFVMKGVRGKGGPVVDKVDKEQLIGWLTLLYRLVDGLIAIDEPALLKNTVFFLSKTGLGELYAGLFANLRKPIKASAQLQFSAAMQGALMGWFDYGEPLQQIRERLQFEGERGAFSVPREFTVLADLPLERYFDAVLFNYEDPLTAGLMALQIDNLGRRDVRTSMKPGSSVDVEEPTYEALQRAVIEFRHVLAGKDLRYWPEDADWIALADEFVRYAWLNEHPPA